MYEEKDMVELLDRYGAEASRSGVLFEGAVEEQKEVEGGDPKTANRKTMAKAEGAKGVRGNESAQ